MKTDREAVDKNQNRAADKELDQNTMAKTRTSLSFERTGLAFERTALANSQTLLSYSRTALAVFASGIGMFEFINNDTVVHIGIVLMAASPLIMAAGIVQYFRVRCRINKLVSEEEDQK